MLKGRDRKETERFVAMRSHYRFDSFFCRPGMGGAHEKGGVEGEVGRFRRRHLVPLPKVDSLVRAERAGGRWATHATTLRHIVGHADSVGSAFRPRIARPAPAARRTLRRWRWLSTAGSTPRAGSACASASIRSPSASPDAASTSASVPKHVEALERRGVVARHARAVGKGVETLEPRPLPRGPELQARSAGRSDRPRAGPGLGRVQRRPTSASGIAARRQLGDEAGTRALIGVLLAHRTLTMQALIAGIERALSVGSVDPDVVLVEARRSPSARPSSVPRHEIPGRL